MSQLRPAVRAGLVRGAFAEVLALAERERGLARTLVSLLYDGEALVRWRAVSMLGRWAAREPEQVRPLVTRLLWTLNDESGGIGWTAAPALGEVGRNAPDLLRSCVRVVVHYLEDPTLLAGVVWAIGRLTPAFPRETAEVVPDLLGHLRAAEPGLRAQVAWTLGEIGDPRAAAALQEATADPAAAQLYVGDELVTREVRAWAREALGKLGRAPH